MFKPFAFIVLLLSVLIAPEAPYKVDATTTSTSITVTWESDYTDYHYFQVEAFTKRQSFVDRVYQGDPKQATFAGLKPGTPYALRVALVDENDAYYWSDTITVYTQSRVYLPLGLRR